MQKYTQRNIGILLIAIGIVFNEWSLEELLLNGQLPLTFKLILWICDLSLFFSGIVYLFSLNKKQKPIIQWILQRWDFFLVLPFTLIFFLLTSFIQTNEIHLYEEGTYFAYYALFQADKLPFIDYFPLYPPLRVYSHIFVEWLFGEVLVIQRLFLTFEGVVSIFVAYLLLSKFTFDKRIRLLTFITILFFAFEAYFLPRWGAMRFAFYVGFILFLWNYLSLPEEKKTLLKLFWLGFFVGISNLYAYDTGIHLTALGIVTLLLLPFTEKFKFTRRQSYQLLVVTGSFMLPFLLWSLLLWTDGKVVEYFTYSYYVFLFQSLPAMKSFLVFPKTRLFLLIIFLVLLFLGAAYYFLKYGLFQRRLTKEHFMIIIVLTGTFFMSASTIRFLSGCQFTLFTLFPMLMWMGFLVEKFSCRIKDIGRKRAAFILFYLGLFILFWRISDLELWNKFSALQRNLHMLESSRGNQDIRNKTDLKSFQYLHEFYIRETPQVSSLVSYLRDHTSPDESILAFPYFTELLPALSGRHSATRYPIPLTIIGSLKQQQVYLSDIKTEKPRYLVFCPGVRLGSRSGAELFPEIYHYIVRQYHPDENYPYNSWAVQIWVRNKQ